MLKLTCTEAKAGGNLLGPKRGKTKVISIWPLTLIISTISWPFLSRGIYFILIVALEATLEHHEWMSVQNVPPPFAVTLCYSKINKCDQEGFAQPGVVVAGPEQAARLTIVIRWWTNVSHHCSTHTASSTRLLISERKTLVLFFPPVSELI